MVGRRALCGTLVAMLVSSASAELAQGNSIDFQGDKLAVRVSDVSLQELLLAVCQKAGCEVRGGLKAPHQVTARFPALPLPEALQRVMNGENFTLVYGEAGKLRAIRLHGAPIEPPKTTRVSAAPPAAPGVSPVNLITEFDQHAPVPISGRLSQAMGSTQVTFRQLFDAATRQGDVGLRAEAVRVAMNAIESDPALRKQVVAAVGGLDDASTASVLRATAGDHATELVTHVVGMARSSEVKAKATTILQQLAQDPHGAPGG